MAALRECRVLTGLHIWEIMGLSSHCVDDHTNDCQPKVTSISFISEVLDMDEGTAIVILWTTRKNESA
jgi:hypothetical protein